MRDVISANEIANCVNWRGGLRWRAAVTGIKYHEKILIYISRYHRTTVMRLISSHIVKKLQCIAAAAAAAVLLDYNLTARQRDISQIDRLLFYRYRISLVLIVSCASRSIIDLEAWFIQRLAFREHTHTCTYTHAVAECGRTWNQYRNVAIEHSRNCNLILWWMQDGYIHHDLIHRHGYLLF